MAQKQPMEYKHGGHTFEYYILPVTGSDLWVAEGSLKSDPNVAILTETFNTEREARLAFMDKAKEIARSKTR